MNESYVEWLCPHCDKDTEIRIEIESPSDYYSFNQCEHCGLEIKDSLLEDKIMEEASEYFVSQAEWYRDR